MKIVADENIPCLEHYFGACELVLKPGRAITRDDLFDANMLIVRSITKVDALLLHDTPVKFVGSTTAGFDHLDTTWLDQAGIQWSVATGCNANAVAEYVVCAIAALQKQGLLTQKNLRAAVIGVGNVGKRVAEKFAVLGFEVLQYDPLRAENENEFKSVSFEEINHVDFISIHTPLTRHGKFPTFHLIDKTFLNRQKNQCVLLNAGRGEVVSFSDLKQYGKHLNWCFDVWENEPHIDHDVLQSSLIATPHIAGYSIEAKIRGIDMIYQAALERQLIAPSVHPGLEHSLQKIQMNDCHDWRDVMLKIYDPMHTTQQLKNHPETFDLLRKHFQERHELSGIEMVDVRLSTEDESMLRQLC